MKRPVRWSCHALDDLKDILRYVAQQDIAVAQGIIDRIEETGDALGAFATGHRGRVSRTYEKRVGRTPYIMAYELDPDDPAALVRIMRVIHGARDWMDEEWPE
jgi:toxin ParE1/3/4